MPFEHVIIDLQKKPIEFKTLSPTGLVPLLQLDDGSLVTESVPISRRVAAEFDEHAQLLPPRVAPIVDSFISLWTGRVEPAYYDVLKAGTESEARYAFAMLLGTLASVEEALFASRMRDTG